MLDIKRVLKAAPTKMRSREPLQQLWTPWGERIDHEWLSARAGNKAFNPAEEGERTLDEGRTPILGEHPRPTMVRDNCTMLNGWWDYAIASIPEDETAPKWRKTAAMLTRDEAVRAVKETAIPQTFDGKILVPFSPESALSGVHQTIYPDNLLWYRTVVHPVTLGGEETVRQIGDANRLILHFEAVDYVCACYVNGQLAGTHVGGYLPFDVDISAFIDPDDAFEIALCVYDPNDSGAQLRGKQKIEREGIWYTAQSGIWQSVSRGHSTASCSSVRKSAATSRTRNCTSSSPTLRTARWWRMRRCRRACARCVRKSQQLPNICGRRPIRICMTCGPNCDTGRRNPRKRRVMRRSRGRSRWMS